MHSISTVQVGPCHTHVYIKWVEEATSQVKCLHVLNFQLLHMLACRLDACYHLGQPLGALSQAGITCRGIGELGVLVNMEVADIVDDGLRTGLSQVPVQAGSTKIAVCMRLGARGLGMTPWGSTRGPQANDLSRLGLSDLIPRGDSETSIVNSSSCGLVRKPLCRLLL